MDIRKRRRINAGWIGLAACIGIGLSACADTQTPQVATNAGSAGQARKACANTRPAYPAEALRSGAEGVVTVGVLVAADGSFLKGEVRKSSGSRDLDQATVAAASGWCWKPRIENGVPVEGWQEFSYTWTLD
jgi:protein TonB